MIFVQNCYSLIDLQNPPTQCIMILYRVNTWIYQMSNQTKNNNFIYTQGVANLELEGMELTSEQHNIARNYQSGKLTHRELIAEALKYARSE